MKRGDPIEYTTAGNKVVPLAFLAGKGGPEADIAWMDENGQWHYEKDVARREAGSKDGNGHTWHGV